MSRTGVIHNPRSRHNLQGEARFGAYPGVLHAAPCTREELDETLAGFATAGLDLLVIDGGDGTVREVVTRLHTYFGASLPPVAVLPSGKTNALAIDLGAPKGWSLEQAAAACRAGRTTRRAPMEVTRAGEAAPFVKGFIFGAGLFVQATDLAQRAHRLGAFNNLAIAVTLAVAAAQTLAGDGRSPWRRGVPMRFGAPGTAEPGPVFLLLASTLKRMPLGFMPFGAPSTDLRTLFVEAPPKQLHRALPAILKGDHADWLEPAGYRRRALDHFDLHLDTRFVFDGESFDGGELRVTRGPEIEFVKP